MKSNRRQYSFAKTRIRIKRNRKKFQAIKLKPAPEHLVFGIGENWAHVKSFLGVDQQWQFNQINKSIRIDSLSADPRMAFEIEFPEEFISTQNKLAKKQPSVQEDAKQEDVSFTYRRGYRFAWLEHYTNYADDAKEEDKENQEEAPIRTVTLARIFTYAKHGDLSAIRKHATIADLALKDNEGRHLLEIVHAYYLRTGNSNYQAICNHYFKLGLQVRPVNRVTQLAYAIQCYQSVETIQSLFMQIPPGSDLRQVFKLAATCGNHIALEKLFRLCWPNLESRSPVDQLALKRAIFSSLLTIACNKVHLPFIHYLFSQFPSENDKYYFLCPNQERYPNVIHFYSNLCADMTVKRQLRLAEFLIRHFKNYFPTAESETICYFFRLMYYKKVYLSTDDSAEYLALINLMVTQFSEWIPEPNNEQKKELLNLLMTALEIAFNRDDSTQMKLLIDKIYPLLEMNALHFFSPFVYQRLAKLFERDCDFGKLEVANLILEKFSHYPLATMNADAGALFNVDLLGKVFSAACEKNNTLLAKLILENIFLWIPNLTDDQKQAFLQHAKEKAKRANAAIERTINGQLRQLRLNEPFQEIESVTGHVTFFKAALPKNDGAYVERKPHRPTIL